MLVAAALAIGWHALDSGNIVELKGQEITDLATRLKQETRRPLTVKLSGTAYLSAPITLGPEASGVRLEGDAVISGGVRLSKWTETEFEGQPAWSSPVPFSPTTLRQVFVGKGEDRFSQTRFPGGTSYFRFAGFASPADQAADWMTAQSQMIYAPKSIDPNWRNLSDVELVVHHYWVTSRLKIKSLDPDKKLVTFDRKSVFKLSDDGYGGGAKPAVFSVENVAELFGQAGAFYFDRPSQLLFLPLPPREAVVPRLSQLLQVTGATNFSMSGLRFAHTEVDLGPTVSGDIQAGYTVPAAVNLTNCQTVSIERCRFQHLGGWGIEVAGEQSRRVTISKSEFSDLGGGSVKLANNTLGNVIADNEISGGGRIFPSACGIWGGQSGDNRIEHNRIRDFYYTGISLGWDWGFADTPAKNNLIANNDISDIGQGSLSDMGGIYVLGKQPGSVISGNRIQNVQARGYGGWGIYLDEGSTGWTVERNLVIGTKTGGFHIHYGGDNVIRRNIVVGAQSDAQLIRVRDDKQGPITFDSNIVVSLDPDVPIVGPAWLKRDVTMKNNIYWSPSPNHPIPFGDDGTGIWLDPKLDRNGLPTNPEVSKRRLQFIDLGQLGPRR